MGQVIGPDGRCLRPRVQVHHNVHLASTHVYQGAILADPPRPAHLDPVDAHVQRGWVKGSLGGTHRRQDSTPVGVIAEDRSRERARTRADEILHEVEMLIR